METEKAHEVIRRLRAKAASSTFPAEAETFTAKADRLVEKYGEPRAERVRRPRYVRVTYDEYMRATSGTRRRPRDEVGDRERRRAPDPGAGEGGLTF